MFKIEKGVLVPVLVRQPHRKYPFFEMEVGDSFLCPIRAVGTAASYYGKRHNRKYKLRKEGEQYRVWRIK